MSGHSSELHIRLYGKGFDVYTETDSLIIQVLYIQNSQKSSICVRSGFSRPNPIGPSSVTAEPAKYAAKF